MENPKVREITQRLSLRLPQKQSLEILDQVCTLLPLQDLRQIDLETSLQKIQAIFPTVTNFEREFVSLCFALATGVGKTRLMGAFIAYLYTVHEIKNFFILAPNLTIYQKLITDFKPNTPKYVFEGIMDFTLQTPEIITGENYEKASLIPNFSGCRINIFNISKINSEVRGGKNPRIKRLSEYLGDSYFNYLAELDDLVILMDESHRYRASAGIRAINDLKPLLGLELTATPFIETSNKTLDFQNIIYDYALGRAIQDGFVKDPAVVTRKDFNPKTLSPESLERIKLEDGIYLHETIKTELTTYALQTGNNRVKPFMLIIARDIDHASKLMQLIQSEDFVEGKYQDKVIQVDSSKTGTKEDEMIERLLKVEQPEEPTEIVIHVNMLKEGWDVTNLYTIVPLRAANSKVLIEQSIGRGLRLPYGQRTGIETLDQLNIVAHDKFQEIVDEARQPGSQIRLQQIILSEDDLQQKKQTVRAQPVLEKILGINPNESILSSNFINNIENNDNGVIDASTAPLENQVHQPLLFESPVEQKIASITYRTIHQLQNNPDQVPTIDSPVQALVREAVEKEYKSEQLQIQGVVDPPNFEKIINQTVTMIVSQTIDIPHILLIPKEAVQSGFHSFSLDFAELNYSTPSPEQLHIQSLTTNKINLLDILQENFTDERLEDLIVSKLVDFNDISYEDHADFLYDLASQFVSHISENHNQDEMRRIIKFYQADIAEKIYYQMQQHFWEDSTDYEVKIRKGFTPLKESAYSVKPQNCLDYRDSPSDKSNMDKYVFTGFTKCLYSEQKFQAEAERILAIILEKQSLKWFKPAKGQFQLYYKWQGNCLEYQPDFVAETPNKIFMLETKARNQLKDAQVLFKQQAAIQWCRHASEHLLQHGGKPWQYALIPHDIVAENMTLDRLVASRAIAGY